MKLRVAFLAFPLILLVIWQSSCSTATDKTVDRSKLSEDEKRLPENAVSAFKIEDGLHVSLFASEPMMLNPTNMDIDSRGRIWVTEGYNYRYNLNPDHPHKDAGDRILILEDKDGDGKAETSTVFYQDTSINAALGIAVMGNKVIVSCSPNVFILTDTNGDDKADKKEILFKGIGGWQHDHAIHAFTFGPDGKLYFNFGNAGNSILDKKGQVIKDKDGNVINGNGQPYRQGMIFRCDTNGNNVEVLAHNFRNNYEVAVDAFGNMWQSDNDDDGNRGVRINYILEYGNYGYTDEMTGAGWRSRRINMEDSIPLQHWHLNDPGVVPNLLQTGSGSPTGMLIYDGEMLPKKFQGQMIHAEPGHNVVRSYPVVKSGAGYTASINNILESVDDNWFRPSDVCVAPDGSLFVADWYDPGVGGHQVGDLNRGRIFRISTVPDTYHPGKPQFGSAAEALESLSSPNLATRYLAWQKLHAMGQSAEAALADQFRSDKDARKRARAFWLLVNLPGAAQKYITVALADKDEDIRTTAFKAARGCGVDLIPLVAKAVDDHSAQVRREALIALRHNRSPQAPALWAQLAGKYDGKDRWYLESLGIAADKQWDTYFHAWLKLHPDGWKSGAGKDIVWRARTDSALPYLARIITEPGFDPETNLKFFRSFDFYQGAAKQATLLSLLEGNHPKQAKISLYALIQLDTAGLKMTPQIKAGIVKSLKEERGTQAFLELVSKYKIRDQNNELLDIAVQNPKKETKSLAVRLLMANNAAPLLRTAVQKDTASGMAIVNALGNDDDGKTKDFLQSVFANKAVNFEVRRRAVEVYNNGWNGQQKLLDLVVAHGLPAEFDTVAQRLLLKAWRQDVKQKATAFYHPGRATASQLPPVAVLLKFSGDKHAGREVFNGTCSACHQVKGSGISFGPDLSEIGTKLSKEALYTAVLTPDAGISFGYEGVTVHLKNGTTNLGYITSETKDDVTMKVMGGNSVKMKNADIASRKKYEHSLMPQGLVSAMSQQQVVDLVEYLAALK